jgi:hypothetical protein
MRNSNSIMHFKTVSRFPIVSIVEKYLLMTITPNRSRFYQLFILFLCVAFTANGQKARSGDKRPNIIFILTDDQRWDALGYAGNKIIQTPEMDKLARKACISKMPSPPHRFVQQAEPVFSQDFMNAPTNTRSRPDQCDRNIWLMLTRKY